jgi:hypothetical protein
MASTRLHAGGLAHDAMRLRGGAGNRNLKGAADEQKEATIEKKISPNRLMVQVPNRFGCPSSTTHRPPSSPRFSGCIVNRNVHMPPGTRKEHPNTLELSMLEARAPLVHAETARFPGSLFETKRVTLTCMPFSPISSKDNSICAVNTKRMEELGLFNGDTILVKGRFVATLI